MSIAIRVRLVILDGRSVVGACTAAVKSAVVFILLLLLLRSFSRFFSFMGVVLCSGAVESSGGGRQERTSGSAWKWHLKHVKQSQNKMRVKVNGQSSE